MTVREIVELAVTQLTVGHLTLGWLAWLAFPILMGPFLEWLMSGGERTPAQVGTHAAQEWNAMCETTVTGRLVRRVETALGPFGPAARLTLWPLWFFQLWIRVEDRGNPGSTPWL